MTGIWKSKTTDLTVTVIRNDEHSVYWENPKIWRGLNSTTIPEFIAEMEPLVPNHQSPIPLS